MNRRSFLAAMAIAPTTAAATAMSAESERPIGSPNGIRVSMRKDDPGYRAFCIARGDGKKIRVYLDGVEQKCAATADESTGMIVRLVITENGNVAHDGENILEETVHGTVRVEII